MLKYDFENNIAVIDLPSIWKINKEEVSVTTISSTDTVSIPNEGYITIQVGNIDPIENNENGSSEQEPTNPDPITPDPVNPDPVTPDPEPDEDQPLYTVGLISDIHYCITKNNRELILSDWGNNNPSESYFADDLRYILVDTFKDYYNVDFIASPGDIATQDLNDFIKFTKDYESEIDKPFYCSMGNHDHLVVYGNNDWTRTTDGLLGSKWMNVSGPNNYGITSSWKCPGRLCGNIPTDQKSDPTSPTSSYYITKGDKDIYVFLHTNYGSAGNESLKQTHPHNLLSESNPYVLQMIADCGKNTFAGNESNFNFQYYLPEDLIWLERIINNHPNNRIFVFSHYFLPNKAGGGNKYAPGASTELMGITFHFLNWLNNTYKNVIWFSGHSHISWLDSSVRGLHWTNTNYAYIVPTAEDNSTILSRPADHNTNYMYSITTNNKPYNRDSANLINEEKTAWNVHLPSMSRPIANNTDQMPACEAAVMFVYADRVEIKKLGYTRNSDGTYTSYGSSIPDRLLTVYNDGLGTCQDKAPEINENKEPDTELNSNLIRLIIKNDTNKAATFSGYLRLMLQEDPIPNRETDFCFRNNRYYPANGSAGWKVYRNRSEIDSTKVAYDGYIHGANTELLAPGLSISITYSKRMEAHSNSPVSVTENISTFFGQHFIQTSSNNHGPIKLGVAISRDVDQPDRVDNNGSYYSIRFTDENGNVLLDNPEIKSKGIYYLSIYDTRPLHNQNWDILPYNRTNDDILHTAYVTVQ